jgi:hypothetical protein
MKNISKIALAFAAVALLLTACSKDFLETRPTSQVDESNISTNCESEMLAINGIHRLMHEGGSSGTTTGYYGQGGYTTFMLQLAFMSDDVVWTYNNVMYQDCASWVHHWDLVHKYNDLNYYWKFFYRVIYAANKILEKIDDIPELSGTGDYRNYVKGQALAYRAFAHFQLVQTWAKRYNAAGNNTQPGVILRLKPTDLANNPLDNAPRSSVEDVYKQINKDLDDAIACLVQVPASMKKNKTHIDQWVAKGLKARVLLTQGRWLEAAQMAEDVVLHSGAALQADTYTCGMFKNQMSDMSNTEWLWAQGHSDDATQHGTLRAWQCFISNGAVSYNRNSPRAILNTLYATIPVSDVRHNNWLENPYASGKKSTCVKPVEGGTVLPTGTARMAPWMSQKWQVDDKGVQNTFFDVPYMRLPEMILIAAEGYARAGGNDLKAQQYLYQLAHDRDPLYVMPVETGDALAEKVIWQRRVELWAEGGLRWFDLKRLNLPCDRGAKPREGFNQGGNTNGWKNTATKMPTNLDPLASNYNMYGEQGCNEKARLIPAGDPRWQWMIPYNEIDSNPLCEQNPKN